MNKDLFFKKLSDLKNKVLHMKENLTHATKGSLVEESEQEKRRLDEETRFYQKKYPEGPQDKVIRESGGQDISAI